MVPCLLAPTLPVHTCTSFRVSAQTGPPAPLPAGFPGLYRGAGLNMAKIAVASAIQLAVFDGVKARLQRQEDGWGRRHPTAALLAAAMAAGLAVTAVIQPVDVVTTRLWNQPGGWEGGCGSPARRMGAP